MKKLSDYQGEEAIELYADLIEPISAIFTDDEIKEMRKTKGVSMLNIASVALKKHPKEIENILLRIDPEPIDGANILKRLMILLSDIGKTDGLQDFFPSAGQENTETSSESIG